MARNPIRRLTLAALLVMAASHSGLAHHSFAMYDLTATSLVRGTVTRFRWVNPHVVLSVASEEESDSTAAIWNVELSSPGNVTRTGLNRRSLNPGDVVEVTLNPLRDGTPGGACLSVTLIATGEVLECGAGAAIRAGERPNLQ